MSKVVEGWITRGGKHIPIYSKALQEDLTVYHGGPRVEKVHGERAFFTTTSKQLADDYSNKGELQEFVLKKGSSYYELDMKGKNWSQAYKQFEKAEGKLTEAQEKLFKQMPRDQLRGIAEAIKQKGYDILKVKSVTDPKGVYTPGKPHLPLDAKVDEYIVVNPKCISKKGNT